MAYTQKIAGAERETLARELRREYEQGATVRELSQTFGESYGFVYTLLRERGTPMRSIGVRPAAKAEQV